MTHRRRGRAATAIAAGVAAACVAVATAGPAFADTVRDQEWWLSSLNVTQAWLSSRGSGVTVAVLDTGVDPAQPDLAGSVTTGRDFTGSGRAAGGPFWGVNGTAVASLIAGHGHGPRHADGIIGVAPQARILSVRVTLENNDPLLANPATVAALPMAIARGIRYAVRHGAQVIDLPLDPAAVVADTAAASGGTSTATGGSPAERAAVAYALSKGIVLVAPAGDGGAGPDTVNFPAAYPGVISVGAFNQTFTKAPFSSGRPYVTLTGPGNGVIAANGTAAYSKFKSTTAASAVVAGITALIRAQFPTLTPAQVAAALTSSTVFHPQGGRRTGSGFGTVDAAAALVAAAKINATLPATASPANPTPPAPPRIKVHSTSLWDALRYPVLGLAALLLIALIVLITVRTRQRRALDAQLAPLRAAARGGRAQAGSEPEADELAPAGAGVGATGAAVPFGAAGGTAVDLAAGGGRTVGRAPFDDPDFVPPSFRTAGLGQAGLGQAGLAPAGLGQAGAGHSGAGQAGLSPAGLGQAGPGPAGLGQAGLGHSGAGQAGLGPAGESAGGFAGHGAAGRGGDGRGGDGPAAGGAGFGTMAAGLPPRGSAAADLPLPGSAAADLPMQGSAAADIPAFGSAAGPAFPAGGFSGGAFPGGAFPGGSGPDAAGPAEPAGGALSDDAAFGRPVAADPPGSPLRPAGSANRLNPGRTPKTTGHPPWEPAEKPKGELPWMDAPARSGGPGWVIPPRPYPGAEPARVTPGGVPPGGSVSGGAGQPGAGQPAGGQTAGSWPGSGQTAGSRPGGGAFAGENGRGWVRRPTADRGPFPELDPPPGADPESPGPQPPRPSWNPADTTDSFPAVNPDDTPLP